jgi:hypothetical protein
MDRRTWMKYDKQHATSNGKYEPSTGLKEGKQ